MKKKLWERHEEEVSLWVPGGYRIPGSGAGAEKLDVGTDRTLAPWCFLYGCKSTTQAGFRLTPKVWKEVEDAAYMRSPDHHPALPIRVYDARERPRSEDVPILLDGVFTSMDVWLEMLEVVTNK